MVRKLSILIVIAGLLIMWGCSTAGKKCCANPKKEIADTELSYRNNDLGEFVETPGIYYSTEEAGESNVFDRAFEDAPPMIPHDVSEYLPIKMSENTCMDCHHPDEAEDAEATAVPSTHFYDIWTDKELDHLNYQNFNCTLCHAPQADAPILIENSFEAEFRNPGDKNASNLLDRLNEGIE